MEKQRKKHTIPCGIDGAFMWRGIEQVGNKLVCCPFRASSVLIIDGKTEVVTNRSCGENNKTKWIDIASCGTKLFCCPYGSKDVLILDDYASLLTET
mmetsp:Transcript_13104/g.14987  ORF Transcript_13104/g.14987 Transcript_13104/m.14987 type:complete len:97 (+) Transcript_13104:1416-1706(+)